MTVNSKSNEGFNQFDLFDVVPVSDLRCEKCNIPLDPIMEDRLCEGCEPDD